MKVSDFPIRLKTLGRNDACPCGSGMKYKKCHLPKDQAAKVKAEAKLAAEEAAAAAAAPKKRKKKEPEEKKEVIKGRAHFSSVPKAHMSKVDRMQQP